MPFIEKYVYMKDVSYSDIGGLFLWAAEVCALRSDRGPAVVGLPVSLAVVERSWRSPFARAVPGWRWEK